MIWLFDLITHLLWRFSEPSYTEPQGAGLDAIGFEFLCFEFYHEHYGGTDRREIAIGENVLWQAITYY